jgi:cyclopropane fatty-acyl-phospholipid synthase-like methyltransferase
LQQRLHGTALPQCGRVVPRRSKDTVDLRLQDYRHIEAQDGPGAFDRIVSCEMLEAVGHEHLPQYFRVVGRLLKPGGRAVVQVISTKDENYARYCASSDFIRAHIFPGGHLPCRAEMDAVATANGLSRADCIDIGRDYAVTLRDWRERWLEPSAQRALRKLGYSDEFLRKYEFYFVYCEAGFECEYIHDYILTWDRAAPADVTSVRNGEAETLRRRVRGD